MMMIPLSLLLLALSSHLLFASGVNAVSFDFGTLTLTSLKLLGDAHLNNGSVRLTRDLPVPNSGAGMAFYNRPIPFRQAGSPSVSSFTTFFSFAVTNLNPSSIGGGLAFVLSPGDSALGDPGASLGLSGPGFVAVEFDTLMDVEFKDINGNHVGLDLGSLVSSSAADLTPAGVDLKSGDVVNAWIEFSGSTGALDVYASYSNVKPKSAVLSSSVPDLDQFLKDFMYVGFSGSTQGSTETHSIEWWSFISSFDDAGDDESSPPPTSTLVTPSAARSPPLSPPLSNVAAPAASVGPPGKDEGQTRKRRRGAVAAGVVTASAFFLAAFGGVLFWLFAKKRKQRPPALMRRSSSSSTSVALAADIMKMPKEFSYRELRAATKGFEAGRVIGKGAFGTVYKGVLPETGHVVAVKRCSHGAGGQGKAEFLSELSIIGTLRHRNLVRLQGWCHERGEILLVYDLMPNGSLDKALFESRDEVLAWGHRRKALLGVASALAYLHKECESLVVHRDVKSSNIMLDEGFNARLGDFGLARQMDHDKSPDPTVAAGTMGYLAPEYLLTGRATEKTDVFSFGAVALEVATGRRPIQKDNGNLVEWVWGMHREGRLLATADARLGGEYDEGEMTTVLLVGLACSHPDPAVRPTMRSVVQMLVGEADVPVVPRTKPSMAFTTSQLILSLQDSVSDCNALLTMSTSSSEGLDRLV